MAEIPVARARRAAFHWPVGSVTAQQTATRALAGARTAGTRFLLPPVASPATPGRKASSARIATHTNLFRFTDTLLVSGAVLIGNTERLTDRTLILPVLHEMGTVSMNRVMNTIHTAARVGT